MVDGVVAIAAGKVCTLLRHAGHVSKGMVYKQAGKQKRVGEKKSPLRASDHTGLAHPPRLWYRSR